METNAGQISEHHSENPCEGHRRQAEHTGDPDVVFSIGEIARQFGLSLRALRFYEDRGLLHPRRRGTARLYSDRDRAHLQLILKGKQLGFTLGEIRELLTSRADAVAPLELQLNLNPDQIVAQIRHLERQRADLDAALSELKAAHQRAQSSDARLSAA